MKSVDIKGKAYIEVNERLKFFRENYPDYRLISTMLSNKGGVCVFLAEVKNQSGTTVATGHAYEKEGSTFINKTSYIENCETSAWGRALGNFGIGIDTAVATADEVQNAMLNQIISDKQAADLASLVEEVGADKSKFLKYFKIDAVSKLPASRFQEALAMLEAKRSK